MAEIEEYLNNFLKLETKEKLEYEVNKGQTIIKKSNETYKMLDDQFIIKKKSKEMIQYATLYWIRLQSIKPHVKELAEIKWEKDNYLNIVNNILDIRPH